MVGYVGASTHRVYAVPDANGQYMAFSEDPAHPIPSIESLQDSAIVEGVKAAGPQLRDAASELVNVAQDLTSPMGLVNPSSHLVQSIENGTFSLDAAVGSVVEHSPLAIVANLAIGTPQSLRQAGQDIAVNSVMAAAPLGAGAALRQAASLDARLARFAEADATVATASRESAAAAVEPRAAVVPNALEPTATTAADGVAASMPVEDLEAEVVNAARQTAPRAIDVRPPELAPEAPRSFGPRVEPAGAEVVPASEPALAGIGNVEGAGTLQSRTGMLTGVPEFDQLFSNSPQAGKMLDALARRGVNVVDDASRLDPGVAAQVFPENGQLTLELIRK
jgi:hypothetical protein